MNVLQKTRKRKLLLEFFRDIEKPENYALAVNPGKIRKLKHNDIQTVFIISSEPVDPDIYLKLINEYSRNDFEIKSIHIDTLDEENLPVVRYQVENILSSLSQGGCLLVSYGNSHALTILGCFFLLTGKGLREARESAEIAGRGKNLNGPALDFLRSFEESASATGFGGSGDDVVLKVNRGTWTDGDDMKPVQVFPVEMERPVPAPPEVIPGIVPVAGPSPATLDDDSLRQKEAPATGETALYPQLEEIPEKKEEEAGEKTVSLPVEEKAEAEVGADDQKVKARDEEKMPPRHAVKEEIRPKMKSIDLDRDFKVSTGKFYTSIRFKLVTIVSAIIILSLTGMIFLATYFFKKDNLVRVQENNLGISDVIALKVNTDITTIIDKSKFIINSVKKGEAQARGAVNVQDLLADDGNIIFTGLMDMPGKMEVQNPSYIIYNSRLMNKMQLLEKDVADAYNANSEIFRRSFEGAKIMFNASRVIENHSVMALSFPHALDAEKKINTIVVIFINMDGILKTFSPKGITRTFMVNDKGEAVIHPDKSLMQSGADLSGLPIVSIMLQSPLDNGQTRFSDEKGTVFLGSFKKLGFSGAGVIAVSEEELALQEVYNIQRRNIYLMISVLSLAVLIVFFFGKSLTSPIKRLVQATNYIKEGHYLVDIRPTSNDEIGQLTASFVEMGKGLEERERMKDAFGKFVNKEIAEQVLHGEIRLGGERKVAAVFFSDIRSFTAISEKMEPEEVVEFLNEYMTRMVKCVNDTNGVVDKYIGDAIMAEWGVPVSKGNDTENAVNAALHDAQRAHKIQ